MLHLVAESKFLIHCLLFLFCHQKANHMLGATKDRFEVGDFYSSKEYNFLSVFSGASLWCFSVSSTWGTLRFSSMNISKLETRLSSLTCYICMLVKNPLMLHLNSLGKHSFSACNLKVVKWHILTQNAIFLLSCSVAG